MRLSEIRNHDFGPYKEFEIEDRAFFRTMWGRMIEDIEVMVGSVARVQERPVVTRELVLQVLTAVSERGYVAQIPRAPVSAIVSPNQVRDFARPAMEHEDQVFPVMAQYVNLRFIRMLQDGAEAAAAENIQTIKLRHFLPSCELWPWPFNRWC